MFVLKLRRVKFELDIRVVKTMASYLVFISRYNELICCTSTATVIPQGKVKIEHKCRIHFAAKYPTHINSTHATSQRNDCIDASRLYC